MRTVLRASLLIAAVCVTQAQAQQTQYSAKFVIGTSNGDILAPGRYFTAINVHNPTAQPITIRKRFAIALPSEKPGPISPFASTTIPPGAAIEIDTRDIHRSHEDSTGDVRQGIRGHQQYRPTERDRRLHGRGPDRADRDHVPGARAGESVGGGGGCRRI